MVDKTSGRIQNFSTGVMGANIINENDVCLILRLFVKHVIYIC